MKQSTRKNLEKHGYTVGDAKDFVEDVLTPKEITPEDLLNTYDKWAGEGDREEILALMREAKAGRKAAEEELHGTYHKGLECGAPTNTAGRHYAAGVIIAAMDSARNNHE